MTDPSKKSFDREQEEAQRMRDFTREVELIRSEVAMSKAIEESTPVQSPEMAALKAELAYTKSVFERAVKRVCAERVRADAAEKLVDSKRGLVEAYSNREDNRTMDELRWQLGESQAKVVQSEVELETLKDEVGVLKRDMLERDALYRHKIDVVLQANSHIEAKYRDVMRKSAKAALEPCELARQMSALKEELAVAKRKEVEGANREENLIRKMDEMDATCAELRIAHDAASDQINVLMHSNAQLKHRLDMGREFMIGGMAQLLADYDGPLLQQEQQRLQQLQQLPDHPVGHSPPVPPPTTRDSVFGSSTDAQANGADPCCRYCSDDCDFSSSE